MNEEQCIDCGRFISDEHARCEECFHSRLLVEIFADPEPEHYMEEPCDHEMRELENGMAQCIYCGVIED